MERDWEEAVGDEEDEDLGAIAAEDAEQIIELDDDAAGDYSDEDEAAAPAAGAPEPAVAEAEAAGEADESMPPAFIDRGNNAAMVLQAHADAVYGVAVSPDGGLVLSGGQDDKAMVWRTDTWECVHVVEAHKDSVIAVGFSADGQYFATGSMDGMIKIWSSATFELVLELDCGDDLTWMEWHPVGRFILAGSTAGAVMMWDVPAGNMSYFSGHIDACTSGAWAASGRFFVTTSDDGALLVWSPKSQEITQRFDAKSQHQFHKAQVTAAACHPDNVLVASGGADAAVNLLNTKTGSLLVTFEGHTDNIEMVAFSHSSPTLLASASLDKTVRIYDVSRQLHLHTCTHDDGVVKIVWHPKLPVLYSCSLDGTIRVWDARSGQELFQCVGHQSHVLDFVISSDGRRVFSSSEDSTVMVFDVANLPAH